MHKRQGSLHAVTGSVVLQAETETSIVTSDAASVWVPVVSIGCPPGQPPCCH
jgi:hypothetical protein